MDDLTPVCLRVWGDYACFTRPEMKVERVSYELMTPSAARGVLEAIYWKPQFDWVIQRIELLAPVRYASILRNELKTVLAASSVKGWAEKHQGRGNYNIEDDRTQRHALILRDVAYNIHAHVRVRPGCDEPPAKFRAQFRRRVERGQCFWTPYLGCREFSAFFSDINPQEQPIPISMPIGRMLFDLKFSDARNKDFGQGEPFFFNAQLNQGVLHVPQALYEHTLENKRNR